jgi:hypothetical protein
VVDDFEGTLAELSELFGYEWAHEMSNPTSVKLPTEEVVLQFSFVYSKSAPRLEIIRSIPGTTLWQPAPGSGVHHVGYWSDDVAADSAALISRGFAAEAVGTRPDGSAYWAYHRKEGRPRIELVTRDLQPILERYWTTGLT